MGMAILAVGASGVIALQKISIVGTTEGRNLTAGSAAAAHHIEAIRTDALQWVDKDTYSTPTLLAAVLASTNAGNWFRPADEAGFAGDDLGAVDVTGRNGSGQSTAYCTHMRATVLANDLGAPDPDDRDEPILLRIETRTFWAKSGRPVDAECDPDEVDTITTGLGGAAMTFSGVDYTADDYGWVFLSTTIRRNDAAVAP